LSEERSFPCLIAHPSGSAFLSNFQASVLEVQLISAGTVCGVCLLLDEGQVPIGAPKFRSAVPYESTTQKKVRRHYTMYCLEPRMDQVGEEAL